MRGFFRKLALPCLIVAWCFSPLQGHAACVTKLSSLDGWYGMLISGSTTAASPVAKYETGAVYFNGAGAITASHVFSYVGSGNVTGASGSYVVNTDCTVTLFLTVGSTSVQTFTVAVQSSGEAVGIETDAAAVAKIDLQAQFSTPGTGLNFTIRSMNGTYAASCVGPASLSSDLNLMTYASGSFKGTDPYNNSGSTVAANNPFSGTYGVNTDGTFYGSLTVDGASFDFYGVISNNGTEVQYVYSDVVKGSATDAFASCTGKAAAAIAY